MTVVGGCVLKVRGHSLSNLVKHNHDKADRWVFEHYTNNTK